MQIVGRSVVGERELQTHQKLTEISRDACYNDARCGFQLYPDIPKKAIRLRIFFSDPDMPHTENEISSSPLNSASIY